MHQELTPEGLFRSQKPLSPHSAQTGGPPLTEFSRSTCSVFSEIFNINFAHPLSVNSVMALESRRRCVNVLSFCSSQVQAYLAGICVATLPHRTEIVLFLEWIMKYEQAFDFLLRQCNLPRLKRDNNNAD